MWKNGKTYYSSILHEDEFGQWMCSNQNGFILKVMSIFLPYLFIILLVMFFHYLMEFRNLDRDDKKIR